MTNITLRMVAAEAGVSLSTASAALQGLDIVKPATRKKVEAAALKLNYRRNSAASVLSSMRNRNSQKQAFIVWLSAYSPEKQTPGEGDWNAGPRFAAKEAERLGLQFAAYNIDHPEDTPRIIREIEARGCDGIIWGTNELGDLPSIPWNRFSVVSTDESRLKDGFDIVLSNQFRSTIELLRRIKKIGYKRIGVCLRNHANLHFDDEVRYGALSAFQHYDQAGAHYIPPIHMEHETPNSASRLADWVKEYKPEVVVGFSIGDITRLKEQGFKIPEDFAYVALHVTEFDQDVLAGRKHNKEVVPGYAVRVLMEKMRHGIRGLSKHPQETEIVPPILSGSSCPGLEADQID